MTPARILIVEDDRIVARDIQQQLERIGHTVVGTTARGEDVVALARSAKPTLVLMDVRLEGTTDGITATDALRTHYPVPVVFLTAYADDQTVLRATRTDPFGYLVKPFDDSQLRTTIELALYKHAVDRRLRDSEHRHAVTLASIADAVITADADGRITYLNPAAEALTGWSVDDGAGRRLNEVFRIVDDATGAVIDAPAGMLVRLGTATGLGNHARLLSRDGRRIPIEDAVAPTFDDAGAITGSVLTFRDISRRRQAEEAEVQRRANARLDLALRGSEIAIWEFDLPDGDIERSRLHSLNSMDMQGYAREGIKTWPEVVQAWHPDDRARVVGAIRAYLAGETPSYEVECRLATKGGAYRTRIARGVAVRDATGKPIRFIGSSIDITDRRAVEEALRESEARYRNTFEDAPAGLVHTDFLRNSILRVNQTYLEMTGYTREEALGPAGMTIIHPDDRHATAERFRRVAAGEISSYAAQLRLRRKAGDWMWVRITASLGRDSPQGAPYLITLVEDISDRNRLERELQAAKEAAEASNRAKDEFLANVSHEIRTPMNAILGMTELVLDTRLEETQRQSLRTVQSAAASLLAVINDLLDFSKIEAGKVSLAVAEFRLRPLLGDTMRALAMRAHRKGLELLCNVALDTPDALVGDAGRLRQVLINLVGNAIKFTEHGEVQVDVTVVERSADQAVVRFAVRDTGIGIPADKQRSIFRAFEQEDMSTTRRYGGTGLGLTIAASLVTMMGGAITVDSTPGRGSTFAFEIEVGWRASATAAGVEPGDALTDLRVLVVDDNAANREILERWLRGWRMDPTAVRDGLSAMDALWHAVASRRPYALILLDARMPDTDGLSLAAAIRDRAELADTRMILLTSGDRPNDPKRLAELRVEAQVLKPVPQAELLATIQEVMARPPGGAARSEPTPVQVAAESPPIGGLPHRVLVAEDNVFNAQLLQQLLASRGHAVRVAPDGRTALQYARSGAFDLLLLDLHMPELDGFEVLEALRDHERTTGAHLPVIALTARARAEDRVRCFAAGADEFLAKPIRAADLWTAIERAVSSGGGAAAPRRETLVTPATLLAAVGGSAAVLAVVRAGLAARLPGALTTMTEALAAHDGARLRDAAHSASSMLAAFSTEVGAIASALEDAAASEDLAAARALLAGLRDAAPALLHEVALVTIESLEARVRAEAETPAVVP
jgi:two-component system sensor histidine kinase/response regulator